MRSHRAKKKAKKEQHNASRYAALQHDKTDAVGEKRNATSASSSREDLSEGERERERKREEVGPPAAYESLGREGEFREGLRGRGDEVVR